MTPRDGCVAGMMRAWFRPRMGARQSILNAVDVVVLSLEDLGGDRALLEEYIARASCCLDRWRTWGYRAHER